MQTQIIRRRRLSDEVLARLEEMILSPEYQPGDQLPSERQLMVRFGVGRTAVREALYSLQKMGLLEIKSGERGRVTKPTPRILLNELGGAARHLLAEPEGERHFQEARPSSKLGSLAMPRSTPPPRTWKSCGPPSTRTRRRLAISTRLNERMSIFTSSSPRFHATRFSRRFTRPSWNG